MNKSIITVVAATAIIALSGCNSTNEGNLNLRGDYKAQKESVSLTPYYAYDEAQGLAAYIQPETYIRTIEIKADGKVFENFAIKTGTYQQVGEDASGSVFVSVVGNPEAEYCRFEKEDSFITTTENPNLVFDWDDNTDGVYINDVYFEERVTDFEPCTFTVLSGGSTLPNNTALDSVVRDR